MKQLLDIMLSIVTIIEHDSIYSVNDTFNTCISDIEDDIKNCICEIE